MRYRAVNWGCTRVFKRGLATDAMRLGGASPIGQRNITAIRGHECSRKYCVVKEVKVPEGRMKSVPLHSTCDAQLRQGLTHHVTASLP